MDLECEKVKMITKEFEFAFEEPAYSLVTFGELPT
jgi:hypothetical protein